MSAQYSASLVLRCIYLASKFLSAGQSETGWRFGVLDHLSFVRYG